MKVIQSSYKVGIFMPYYNMGKFIDESVDSLDAQTYKNFTVIIADDCSNEAGTKRKLERLVKRGFSVFFEKKNLGLVKISNKYMAKLDAEYIMLFSPDDKMHPRFLEEQVNYLDSHPDVSAVCVSIQEFGEGDRIIKYTDNDCTLPKMLVENRFSGAALMRKESWLKAGMHDTDSKLYPNLDYDLWLSMLSKGMKLGTVNKTLFYWRVVKSSLSHNVDARKQLTFRKALLNKYSDTYKEHFEYVMGRYMEKLSDFENYYSINEVGHAWLDSQYHSLNKENQELRNERDLLYKKLEHSIERPYIRSAIKKMRSLFSKN